MTDRLPSLTAAEVIKALQKAGFEVVRISGSHHRLVNRSDPTKSTTVPMHKGRDLAHPLVRAIIKQAGLTVEEFTKLL